MYFICICNYFNREKRVCGICAQSGLCVIWASLCLHYSVCPAHTPFFTGFGGGSPYLIFALSNYGILWRFQCGQRLFILFTVLKIPITCDSYFTQPPKTLKPGHYIQAILVQQSQIVFLDFVQPLSFYDDRA